MSKKSINRLDPPPIPQEEWDFSLCESREIRHCYFYELLREFNIVRQKVAEWRKQHPGSSFDDWLPISSKNSQEQRPRAFGYELFNYCPEWPERPYLSIPKAELKRRIEKIFVLPLKANEENALRKPVYSGDAEPDLDFLDDLELEVDWRHSDRAIVRRFGVLIRKLRPEGVKQWKTRGMGRDSAQMKKDLKALAAWRLLKLMRWDDAAQLTYNRTNKSLFENETAWIRARNHMACLLAAFHASRFIPAPNSR